MRAFYERWLWIMKLFSVQESRLSPRAAKHSNTLCELLNDAASSLPGKVSCLQTCQVNGFSETHCYRTSAWHIVSLRENVVGTFYVCGNDRHAKFDGKQGRAALECLHLTVLRPSALGIKDEAASILLHELPTRGQAGRKRLSPWLTIDGYDIHQRRDRPAQASRAKEIVAGADQSKAAKAAPARRHQDRTVRMAGVIAAKQKGCVRKMMSLLYREGTIPLEERPAKAFETQTAWR